VAVCGAGCVFFVSVNVPIGFLTLSGGLWSLTPWLCLVSCVVLCGFCVGSVIYLLVMGVLWVGLLDGFWCASCSLMCAVSDVIADILASGGCLGCGMCVLCVCQCSDRVSDPFWRALATYALVVPCIVCGSVRVLVRVVSFVWRLFDVMGRIIG